MKYEPWRLIFEVEGVRYKFCNFWGWEKDPTLNFKLYSKVNSPIYEIENIEQKEVMNQDGAKTLVQTIPLDKLRATDFVPNKKTFHPTGFTHTTDKDGQRYESGIRSLSFDSIETFRQLMLIIPQHYQNLPTITPEKCGTNDVIVDLKHFGYKLFQVEVYIVRGGSRTPVYPELSDGVNLEIYCGDSEEYMLFVRCRQTPAMANQDFPQKTLIGTVLHTS